MKKLFLLILLIAVEFICVGQPQRLGLTLNMGSTETLGGELSIRVKKNNFFGFGYAGFVGEYDNQEFKNEALYLTYARKLNKFIVGARLGKQNDASWVPTPENPNVKEKYVTAYVLMYGGFAGYQLNNDLRLNLGYDNFNMFTFGLTIKLF